jgi:hypothetical protein
MNRPLLLLKRGTRCLVSGLPFFRPDLRELTKSAVYRGPPQDIDLLDGCPKSFSDWGFWICLAVLAKIRRDVDGNEISAARMWFSVYRLTARKMPNPNQRRGDRVRPRPKGNRKWEKRGHRLVLFRVTSIEVWIRNRWKVKGCVASRI